MKARTGFRADIQGLRAVAVVLVLLFHAGFGVTGGYVGVDVFFVLSGFLITGILADEAARDGRVRLARFYAKRVRRLLPASALVLLVTVALSWVVLDPLRARDVTTDGIWATGYAANLRFMLQDLDYFAADRLPSPLLHYWSLAVEEQFYFVWPLLLGAGAALRRSRRGIVWVLAAITVASFLHSVALSDGERAIAYYSPLSRAWEMGAGGLLALAVRGWPARLPRPAGWLGWVGLALITATALAYDDLTRFPGLAAVPVVLGTALTLLPGSFRDDTRMERVLALRPVQLVGDVSYSLYLWHWPVLVLAAAAVPGEASAALRAAALVLSLALSVVTYRTVEEPARRARALADRHGAAIASGLSVTVLVMAVGAVTLAGSTALGAGTGTGPEVTVADVADLEAAIALDQEDAAVPADLQPPLVAAEDSQPVTYEDGCHATSVTIDVETCTYNASDAAPIVLFGDSYAAHWFPAMLHVAEAAGRPLVNVTIGQCPSWELPVYRASLGGEWDGCVQAREARWQQIAELEPAVVVLTNSDDYNPAPSLPPSPMEAELPDDPTARYLTGIERGIERAREMVPGARIVVLNVPDGRLATAACVASHLDDVTACDQPRTAVFTDAAVAERRGAAAGADLWVDTAPLFCGPDVCPAVVGRTLVSYDGGHITEPYSELVGPALADLLAPVLQ